MGTVRHAEYQKATFRTRTGDLSFTKARVRPASSDSDKTCITDQLAPASSPDSTDQNQAVDDQLRHIIDAWPDLPEAIRAGIVAMVSASGSTAEGG